MFTLGVFRKLKAIVDLGVEEDEAAAQEYGRSSDGWTQDIGND